MVKKVHPQQGTLNLPEDLLKEGASPVMVTLHWGIPGAPLPGAFISHTSP